MANVDVDIVPPPGPGPEPALPLDLIFRALEMLSPNEMVLNGRLVSKGACQHLSQLRTARFGLPLPAQALEPAWQPHLLRALRLLTLQSKVSNLRVAASTGNEINVELAWGLLRPFVVDNFYLLCVNLAPAAIKAGHAHLLTKMIQLDIPFTIHYALEAAAEHCDLAGLHWVWELLGGSLDPPGGFWPREKFDMVRAAGGSACDAVNKVSWMLQTMGEEVLQQHLQEVYAFTAEAAAAAGNLPVLRLLLDLGMDLPSVTYTEGHALYHEPAAGVAPWCVVLTAALQGGHVAVADWLLDEAGCPVPSQPPQQEQQHQQQVQDRVARCMWKGAARGGKLEAMCWLLRHGVPVHWAAMEAAASDGHLEAVQFLHRECGLPLTWEVFRAAVGSGSLPTATWLLQAGCPVGQTSCDDATCAGNLNMVRWLAFEVGCPWGHDTLTSLVYRWESWSGGGANSECPAQALRVLAEAGCAPLVDSYAFDSLAASGDQSAAAALLTR